MSPSSSTTESSNAPSSTAEKRHQPKQQRSIERVNLILETSAEVIREFGIGEAKTSEIAKRAGISLASLYRYFPNLQAITRALAEQHIEELQAHMLNIFEGFDLNQNPQDVLVNGVDQLLDMYMDYYQSKPGYLEIWTTVQASPELVELDRQELYQVVDAVTAVASQMLPQLDEETLRTMIAIVTRSCGAVMYLALEEQNLEKREQMLTELKLMSKAYLKSRLHDLVD